MKTQVPYKAASAWPARLLGAVLLLIGLVLAAGGLQLLLLGGSLYYLPAGLGLIIAGVLMIRRSVVGVWVYLAVFLATVIWALWEVGLDGWALIPRLVGPTVLLVLALLLAPTLTVDRRPRRLAWRALVVSVAGLLVLSLAAFIAGQPARHGQPSGPELAAGPSAGSDWPAYGGTYGAQRYSALAQITPQNVGKLQRAWLIHTGDLPASETARKMYGAETTPLKVGNTLYLCTPKNIMIALDPETGATRWRFDPKVPDAHIPYTAACRGVSYYAVPGASPGSACATRIIEGTLDARLIAVDANTGRPCADFGFGGQVNTAEGIGEAAPGMFSITSAPTIVRGVIVTGHQVLDGQKRNAPSGVIQGYDAVTGQLRWAWDMVRPDRPGAPPAGETYTRGTPNMWTTASGDEALGLVYLPLGNSAVDYWSGMRSSLENEHSTSLVALNVADGREVWKFQTVHKDVWDYDLGSQATLVDYPTSGGVIPALVLPSKQGDLYVLDRRTGRPLTGVEERKVPQGGVEPGQRSPTQPFSLFHTLRKADLTERTMWGMSPIDQMICRIQFRKAKYDGFYTPPISDGRYVEYPGYNGGSDWGGVAVDPRKGVIVANYNDMPNYNRLVPRAEADKKGWAPRGEERGGSLKGGAEGAGDPQAGTPYGISVNAGWRLPVTGLLCKQPPYGGLRAIDLRTGKTLWDRPLGSARRNGPFGIPSHLPIEIGTPNNGGAVVTAGGVIFIAATTDNMIRAIDLKTGKTLWQDALPAGGQATPMTYEVGGRQYLVIMAGGHHFMETPIGDALIAYALPR
ncbi:membrane-bound PQQ-dependent dehydrogenase, glucose/quinate/shikimate family [Caulobacter segnis]|uniref:Membrane-bound PQQ-dependent dehydrogenase, glucose/quinate/shikimate family n=1 Tax=Caulobacter segnis TaxID=88688 RepID=A0A2W5V4V7_9CAUL|nr:membrane-bound PQQ-dependent dehydrogenase, glucose/quinate/shikimate family [Caulobacter segnis]PZR34352.1 MAG: membrane-bound PQQ-dependent dehydrogenase, glucose/quinate/shikimate family [Caulobacter segnis]